MEINSRRKTPPWRFCQRLFGQRTLGHFKASKLFRRAGNLGLLLLFLSRGVRTVAKLVDCRRHALAYSFSRELKLQRRNQRLQVSRIQRLSSKSASIYPRNQRRTAAKPSTDCLNQGLIEVKINFLNSTSAPSA